MVNDWVMRLPLNLIYCVASDFKLNAYLVASICHVESGGELWKTRYEPGYRWTVSPEKFSKILKISDATERNNQQTSWGLLQIMGGTARYCGYQDDIPKLARARDGLLWGCKYLRNLTDKYDTVDKVIAAYNAGSPRLNKDGQFVNQTYVDKVSGCFLELTK